MQNLVATPKNNYPGVKVSTNCPVTAMTDNGDSISVTVNTATGPIVTPYAAVFNTTTMGCLERMDLTGLKLESQQTSGVPVGETLLMGIRALSYDRAAKVAIKFSKPWWADYNITDGGVSSSDLPVSNVVYPSWNDGPEKPAVLMVSYSWSQDAGRMGSIIPDYGDKPRKDVNDPIVTLCLRNLAQLWTSNPSGKPGPTFDTLQGMYMSHHAYAWSHDPNTAGAFALFGPGQFVNMYGPFSDPYCNGKFYMAGEAISAHHAWISGALDSAYTALMQYHIAMNATDAQAMLTASPFGGGPGKHPAEVDPSVLVHKVELSVSEPVNANPLSKALK